MRQRSNFDKANHGGQDVRIAHQMRHVLRRDTKKAFKEAKNDEERKEILAHFVLSMFALKEVVK